jgi:hypothetical protein
MSGHVWRVTGKQFVFAQELVHGCMSVQECMRIVKEVQEGMREVVSRLRMP